MPIKKVKRFTLFAHPGYSILLTHEVLDKIIFSHGKHGTLVRVHRDRQLINLNSESESESECSFI